jgi:putative transposase
MFVAEKFLHSLVKDYGKHQISTDGGTWYPYVCKLLNIKHIIYIHLRRSIIERTIQYVKDRTEYFVDDYFPCTRSKCKLNHVKN